MRTGFRSRGSNRFSRGRHGDSERCGCRHSRAAIAHCWLSADLPGAADSAPETLGTITLRPHQMDAVRQLRRLLADARGAVLADAVGLGKTFVALALAHEAKHPFVVAPAGLSAMWHESGRQAGVAVRLVTMEALSRAGSGATTGHGGQAGPATQASPRPAGLKRKTVSADELHALLAEPRTDLVVVDEAHHFRNPATRRYRALARLTVGARVLLVTATPVHNRTADLAALLSLFLGAEAWTLSDNDRARYVVRRGHSQVGQVGSTPGGATVAKRLGVPVVEGPHPVAIADNATTLHALAALPPPVPPSDGGDAGALVTIALVRQWASSGAALRAALERRLARAVALEAGLEAGAYPSYRDLREWCIGEGAVQLAFPEMLLAASPEARRLLPAVRAHAAAIRALLNGLAAKPDPDAERAARLGAIVRTHEGARVVAFSVYEDTVRALYRRLRGAMRVCGLSAGGGVVAGGRLSRLEATVQFAPGYAPPRVGAGDAERIDLLLTTDLLSEGVNLQGASVVVHLDLPWTPARLEQRVGRVARMGSAHERVQVYAMSPPAASESLLGVERRLRAKLAAAGRAVGIAGSIVPAFMTGFAGSSVSVTAGEPGPPEQLARARAIVARWREGRAEQAQSIQACGPVYAAVRAPVRGFLAACIDGGGRRALIAWLNGRVSEAPADIAAAVRMAEGEPVPHDEARCRAAIAALDLWWARRRATADAGLGDTIGATARRRILARIAAISHRAPRHIRPRLAGLIARAWRAALVPCGAGAEAVLGELGEATMSDVAWLGAVGAFGDAQAAGRSGVEETAPPPTVAGLIVFVCQPREDKA